jgi:hypothetical protein
MRRVLLSCVSALVLAPAAEARVVEWEILKREPTFEGRSFGSVGPYEKVVARAKMAVRPEDAHKAGIVDLGLAPRNGAGEVEFTTQVYILKPTEPNDAGKSTIIAAFSKALKRRNSTRTKLCRSGMAGADLKSKLY